MKTLLLKCLSLILLFLVVSCGGEKALDVKKTGNPELDRLNALIKNDSTNHQLLFQRGEFYFNNNYYEGAINDLDKAINISQEHPEYYHVLSNALMDNLQSREALSVMEECIKAFPKRTASLLKLAETQLILQQYDNSLATCSRILSLNDQNAEAYFMMGMNLRSVSDMERAKTAFRKATEIDPELTDAWIILGQILEDEKDPSAIEYYEAAIDVDRSNPTSWHSKAYYLQNNDRIEEALEIYREINVIDKNYLDAYLNAGILLLSLDSLDQAYEQFNIMVNIKPANHLGHFYRGITNEALGRIDLAKEDYNNTLKLNAKFERAQEALASLLKEESESTQ